jgi:hypothetical protein
LVEEASAMLLMGKVIVIAALTLPASDGNWCRPGDRAVIPDGRDGPITEVVGDYCAVLAYGEAHPKRWAYYLLEPTNPRFGR